jgi:hypothetical protein
MRAYYEPVSGNHSNDVLLSVILVTSRDFGMLLPAIECLREQTLAARIELLVVARSEMVTVGELASVCGFAAVGLVRLDEVGRRGRAAAHAVPFARGRFVALLENHSFGKPDMYERIIKEFDDSTAAVSPNVRSANPHNLWGLGSYIHAYGDFAPPLPTDPPKQLPHHSSVYRRDILERFHHRLPSILEKEYRLHETLIRSGFRLKVSADATTFHINEGRWRRCCSDPLILGKVFGASRSREWTKSRRIFYGCLLPAIVGLHLLRFINTARRLDETRDKLLPLTPRLLVIATAFGAGEVIGYLTGSEEIPEHFEEHEFHIVGRLAGQPVQNVRLQSLLRFLPADAA